MASWGWWLEFTAGIEIPALDCCVDGRVTLANVGGGARSHSHIFCGNITGLSHRSHEYQVSYAQTEALFP